MVAVEFNNQTNFRLPQKKITKLFNFAFKVLKQKGRQIVSLAFVAPRTIQKFNKQYRRKNTVTDVLSFRDEGLEIGEIIICPFRAKKQAKEINHSLQKEILRLSLHGYLHLLGYDHEKLGEAKIMEKLEEEIIGKYYD